MERKRLVIIFFLLPVSLLCIFATTVVAFVQGRFPAAHLGPIALAPHVAAADMLNNRGTIQNFQVQSMRAWPGGQLVVHHYTVSPPGQPMRPEFGYALVELRRGGWSVVRAELAGSLPPPARVSFATSRLDDTLLVYGRVIDPQVEIVEMTADTGQSMRASTHGGGFTFLAPTAQTIRELRVLDQQGQVLERYNTPELLVAVP